MTVTTMPMIVHSNKLQRQVEVTGLPAQANAVIPCIPPMPVGKFTILAEALVEGKEEGK